MTTGATEKSLHSQSLHFLLLWYITVHHFLFFIQCQFRDCHFSVSDDLHGEGSPSPSTRGCLPQPTKLLSAVGMPFDLCPSTCQPPFIFPLAQVFHSFPASPPRTRVGRQQRRNKLVIVQCLIVQWFLNQ